MKPEHRAYEAWLQRDLENYRSILLCHRHDSECVRNTDGTPTGVWEDVVAAGDIPFARVMVDEFGIGVDESPFGSDQEGPIYRACENGHLEIVLWLLARGAKLNYVIDGKLRCRALHCAIRERHLDLARKLVEQGAEINDNDDESTALDTAIVWQAEEAVKWLRSIGGHTYREIRLANPTPLDDPEFARSQLRAFFPLAFDSVCDVPVCVMSTLELQSRFVELCRPLVGIATQPAKNYVDQILSFAKQVSTHNASNSIHFEWGESRPHRLPGVVDLCEYNPEWDPEIHQWFGITLQIHTEDGEESLYLCLYLYFAPGDERLKSYNCAGKLGSLERTCIKMLGESNPRRMLDQIPVLVNAFISDA